jgi:HTH-type transcriptional regulator/antitoxin HigA
MNWKILKKEEEYNKASMRLMELFHAKENTTGFEELQLLLVLVSNYDQLHYNTLLETGKKL